MKKEIVLIVAGILLFGGGYLIGGQRAQEAPASHAPVAEEAAKAQVGAILPLSGDLAIIGDAMRQGMDLGLNDFDNVEITYEDDQTMDANAAINALNKLVDADQVDMVFNSAVNTVKALKPKLEESQTAGMVVWDSNQTIAGISDYVYGFGYSTELAGGAIAAHGHDRLGVSRVAVVSMHDEWSEIITGAFIEKFEGLGGQVVLHEKIDFGTADFRTIIAKAKQQEADSIFFPLFPEEITLLVRQIREMGFEGQLLSADGFIDENIADLGELAEGIFSTQPWVTDPELLAKYRTAHGQEADPISLAFVGLGYDAVRLVSEIVDQIEADGKETGPQTIREYLRKVPSSGFTGETDFSESNITDKQYRVIVVENGKFQPVE